MYNLFGNVWVANNMVIVDMSGLKYVLILKKIVESSG